ncbi:hypothetical protein [Mycobacteroides abscessus]|uniref:hypothetical protein n=1 Tax=Mycobacteroides abscessus TaxID=36809 RepID=UPI000C25A0F6|nr:hypothetical protein [Mycobacteroides abscessus]
MRYQVTLGFVADQTFEVEADDPDEAIDLAFAEGMDHPNISNKFQMSGDEAVLGVWDEDGNEVVKSEL